MKKFVSIISLVLVAAMLCVSLVSCGGPAKDPADAKAALEENGYTALKDTTVVPFALGLLGVKGVDCAVTGTKVADDKVDSITIVYFTDADAAETAFDKVKEYADEEKEEGETWVVKQSGAMIYFGTEQAVKDAK